MELEKGRKGIQGRKGRKGRKGMRAWGREKQHAKGKIEKGMHKESNGRARGKTWQGMGSKGRA